MLSAGAERVVVVVSSDRLDDLTTALSGLSGWTGVAGGPSRSASVLAGVAAVNPDCATLVHDAARPFLTPHHVACLLAALRVTPAATLALPVADTLKRGQDGRVIETASRSGLWRAQTPQGFAPGVLRAALAAAQGAPEPTDDVALVERQGLPVGLVQGDPMLFKLTYPEDFEMAERLAGSRRQTRIGQGVDAHRFGSGDWVWLCGVRIAHTHGLVGHSDADAGLHALTDAILGAIGEGDIGQHFPPSDPKWRGASSDRFLAHAASLVAARGGGIVNVDVTLVCEGPRIGPHREAMRSRIAEILAISVDRVSVKATTTEGMGFTGREEGVLAQAVAMVETPA
jgi:2-C-methyl-D-erythritol 4-phosphate cytidylyltransferase/2-C-methyl-D-erythritol 2,4-cyclodiphosphate synthase